MISRLLVFAGMIDYFSEKVYFRCLVSQVQFLDAVEVAIVTRRARYAMGECSTRETRDVS